VHRDLKTENILFTKSGDLKLCDFGCAHFAKETKEKHMMTGLVGTPYFQAPDVLQNAAGDHKYTYKCDYWSLGVILFQLLCGFLPFQRRTMKGIYDQILGGKYKFDAEAWKSVSEEAKECVRGLLQVDSETRFDFEKLKQCRWFRKHIDMDEREKLQAENGVNDDNANWSGEVCHV